ARLPGRYHAARTAAPGPGPLPAGRVLPDREGDLSWLPDPGAIPDHARARQRPGRRPREPGPGPGDRRPARRRAAGPARRRAAHGRGAGGPPPRPGTRPP